MTTIVLAVRVRCPRQGCGGSVMPEGKCLSCSREFLVIGNMAIPKPIQLTRQEENRRVAENISDVFADHRMEN